MQRVPLLKLVLLLGLAGAVSIGGSEILLRISGYKPELAVEWYLNCQQRVLDDEIICIDPLFLEPTHYQITDGNLIIVALGDSYAAGYPVDSRYGFPAALAVNLKAQGVPCLVTNFGLGNSGPDQHLRLFRTRILEYRVPDVVVWSFCLNDVRDALLYSLYTISSDNDLLPVQAKTNWLYRRQQLFDLAPIPRSWKEQSRLFKLLLKSTELLQTVTLSRVADPAAWALAKIKLELEAMIHLAHQHGFMLLCALVKPQFAYTSEFEAYRQQQPGLANEWWCYQQLYAILQQYEGFVDASFTEQDIAWVSETLGQSIAMEQIAEVLFASPTEDANGLGGRHLNKMGYWLVGSKIAQRLLNQLPRVRIEQ